MYFIVIAISTNSTTPAALFFSVGPDRAMSSQFFKTLIFSIGTSSFHTKHFLIPKKKKKLLYSPSPATLHLFRCLQPLLPPLYKPAIPSLLLPSLLLLLYLIFSLQTHYCVLAQFLGTQFDLLFVPSNPI